MKNPGYGRPGLRRLRFAPGGFGGPARRLLSFVGRGLVPGARHWSVSRLATELGLPGIAVAQMAASLERAGLLMVTDQG